MKIAIGSDHHGLMCKELLKKQCAGVHVWIDLGCAASSSACDYPVYAQAVVQAMASGTADAGVLLCGTGVGMSIAANRCPGIYAGLAWNEEIARLNKEHDNVNVLVLPADYVTPEQAVSMVNAWLAAQFLGGRHQERIDEIKNLKCKR